MLFLRSIVCVADNSGAKVAMVIKILGKPAGAAGLVGDRCVVVCKQAKQSTTSNKQKVSKSDICHAIITRTRSLSRCFDGRYIKFGENAVVLIDKKGVPLGTRLQKQGLVAELLHKKNFLKLQALAPLV